MAPVPHSAARDAQLWENTISATYRSSSSSSQNAVASGPKWGLIPIFDTCP